MITAIEALPPSEVLPPEKHPAAVYLDGLTTKAGRVAMRSALNQVARLLSDGRADADTLPWQALRCQHVAAVRKRLGERCKPATVNKALSAVRRCLKEAWRLGLMTAEQYHKAVDVPNVRGSRLPVGRSLEKGEVKALLEVCRKDRRAVGARDAAAVVLMAGAGLRRAEAAAVRMEDCNLSSTGEMRIIGKGDKERFVCLAGGGIKVINAWVGKRGDDPGPLLCPISQSGQVEIRNMTSQALMLRLKERCRQARIEPCSPHDLRRTFVSNLLESGVDIVTVQKLAGHASPETTSRYDRRGKETLHRAASMLNGLFD